MNTQPILNSGWLKGLLLAGLLGLVLGWSTNQWVAWQVAKRAEQWVASPLPKILAPRVETKPAAPVEFEPGIIQEQTSPPLAEDTVAEDTAAEDTAAAQPPPRTHAREASTAEQNAPSKSAPTPSIPTRGFTIDREALRTQFDSASDLYRHGHYAPNEVDGVRRGLRFLAVAPGGVFARLGFQPGDVVLSVNGVPLNSQNDVLANFEKMRKMSVLKMRLERDGRPLEHRYLLK